MREVVPGLYQLDARWVNMFLFNTEPLVLLDGGSAGAETIVESALLAFGKSWEDLGHIVVSHCHPDHSGGLAAIKRLSGAKVHMHPLDARMVQKGLALRTLYPAPGPVAGMLFRKFIADIPETVEACQTDTDLRDGQFVAGLPLKLRVLHTPGHSEGHCAFLWEEQDKVLLTADACAHVFGLGYSVAYEDFRMGEQSLTRLSALSFDVACFGHGNPILKQASQKFRKKWGV